MEALTSIEPETAVPADESQQATPPRRVAPARPRSRAIGKWIKRGVLAVSALSLAGLIGVAMLPKPIGVDLAVASKGPIRVTVDEDGTTRVKDRYVVSAPLTGSLARIELTPGDAVQRSDALARLVPLAPPLLDERAKTGAEARVAGALAGQRQSRAMVERARAHEEFVTKDVERKRTLVQSGALAQGALDEITLGQRTAAADVRSAEFGSQIADYELDVARAALGRLSKKNDPRSTEDQLVVASPVGGRVLKVFQKSEGVVQAGTPLVELGDPSALEIVVDVLTSDAVEIGAGAEAEIVDWGGPSLPARVRTVEPSAFTRISALGVEEQRVNVVLDRMGPSEAWKALGDGYRIKARMLTHERSDAIKVPSSAVFRRGSGWAVFRARGDAAELVPVELGLRTPREVEIASGIEVGDAVVLHPSDRIKDGAKIAAR